MATAPVTVEFPAPGALRYGLFTVAGPIALPAHAGYGGVQWDTYQCGGTAHAWPLACPVPDGVVKVPGDPTGWREADPFAVYAMEQCAPVGRPFAEAEAHVRQTLTAGEQTAVERILWSGDAATGIDPTLATADAQVLAPTGDLVTALGEMDQWLATSYGYPGLVHAPVRVAALAARENLILAGPNGLKMTPGGNIWVFGGGYDGSSPTGTAPADGHSWLYGTSRIAVYRGDVVVPPVAEVFDRSSNTVYALAERIYLVAVECGAVAAVDATLGDVTDTGEPSVPDSMTITPSSVTLTTS